MKGYELVTPTSTMQLKDGYGRDIIIQTQFVSMIIKFLQDLYIDDKGRYEIFESICQKIDKGESIVKFHFFIQKLLKDYPILKDCNSKLGPGKISAVVVNKNQLLPPKDKPLSTQNRTHLSTVNTSIFFFNPLKDSPLDDSENERDIFEKHFCL